MIMPVMQCAVEDEQLHLTIFDARAAAEDGLLIHFLLNATLVAIPTLLNEKQVRERNGRSHIANRDPSLHFALLAISGSRQQAQQRNSSRSSISPSSLMTDWCAHFILVERHRIFNIRQGVWMGWERKRGKLLDLNKLLVGEFDILLR